MKRGAKSFGEFAHLWIKRICPVCGKEYDARKNRLEKSRNLTCTAICGTRLSHQKPEYKKKASNILKRRYKLGLQHSPFQDPILGPKLRARIDHKYRLERSHAGRRTPESREKTRQQMLKQWKSKKWNKSFSRKMKKVWSDPEYKARTLSKVMKSTKIYDTDIELIVEAKLKSLGVAHEKQRPTVLNWKKGLRTVFPDFYVPSKNLVIECDGDYWHAKKRSGRLSKIQRKNIKKDAFKKQAYKKNGYVVLFLWGSNILSGAYESRLLAVLA